MKSRIKNQEGSALIIALLVLVLLTIMGMAATRTSENEIRKARNQLFLRVAFNHADSGVYATPKLISDCVDNDVEPGLSGTGVSYLGTSGTFYREVMGFDGWDTDKDVRFTLGGFNVDVDVNRTSTGYLAGGGVEFASGAEGVGAGSAGGVAIFYDMDSVGDGPSTSESNIGGVYRKVVGVAGGL